jgi:hypothetical protein
MKNFKPKYGVFIIESMDIVNEGNGKLDGWILKTILDLCDIENQYYYIRTKKELENIIEIFDESEYAFLHLACHGSESSLSLCYDDITFDELEDIIGETLYYRRLFLSACKAARFELAQHFIPKYYCLSVIGTPDNIDYDKAAVFWSSFYYLMYQMNKVSMPQTHLMPILENVTTSFKLRLNYFSVKGKLSPLSSDHLREFNYDSGKLILKKDKKTAFRNLYR